MKEVTKDKFLIFLAEVSRIVVGATFLFSGFVKAVDPWGFTYKIQDYLVNFNLTGFFDLALPVAIFLSVLEFLTGLFLLLGIYRKQVTILVALFMAFFLPLTLWIAITNPVKDCGCFGDALIISNWATFYKNIVLSAFALYLLFYYKLIIPLFGGKMARYAALYSTLFAIAFAVCNVVRLPVFDFRPFKIGSDIPEQMTIDPEKAEVVENVFIYSKDGIEKEFSENNYPWDDSTWVYVDMQSRVIKKGEMPKIEDFNLTLYALDEDENKYYPAEDITDRVLSDSGYHLLMVSCFLKDINMKHLDKLKKAAQFAQNREVDFYLLTASSGDEIKKWSEKNNAVFNFVMADERVLKTMIRTNPGLLLIRKGVVLNKWDGYDVPDFSKRDFEELNAANRQQTNNTIKLLIIMALLIVPLVMIKFTGIIKN